MNEVILKSMKSGQIVEVMYMAKNGQVTKRRLKVIKLQSDSFQAYCFLRNTKRTFKVDNVLALIPITRKESAVI